MPNEEVKERNIEHVLKTAYELFLANGIENTSKEMLVRASGISRSSLDRYFADKTDCVLKVAEWVGNNVRDNNIQIQSGFRGTDKTGLEMLKSYMEIVRDLLYEKPVLFILGVECRDYIYRNCKDYKDSYGRLYSYLGSSVLIKKIFERGVEDESIAIKVDIDTEAIFTRESLIGFFTSIALTGNLGVNRSNFLIEKYIETLIDYYRAAK